MAAVLCVLCVGAVLLSMYGTAKSNEKTSRVCCQWKRVSLAWRVASHFTKPRHIINGFQLNASSCCCSRWMRLCHCFSTSRNNYLHCIIRFIDSCLSLTSLTAASNVFGYFWPPGCDWVMAMLIRAAIGGFECFRVAAEPSTSTTSTTSTPSRQQITALHAASRALVHFARSVHLYEMLEMMPRVEFCLDWVMPAPHQRPPLLT